MQQKIFEIENEELSTKLAIYEQIDRLQKQYPKATTKDTSRHLIELLREYKKLGAQAYSIQHSATTELAKLHIPERDLATFTHHSKISHIVYQYYIFASSTRATEIVRQLTSNPGKINE
ncbi:MAG: hypothetical protein EZS28_032884, partial [Streblomastix strix]